MPALSERKMQIVRTLVEAAPDQVVGGLHAALAGTGGDSALASVRRMVESEARDRQLRNIILQPIVPMCVGDGRDPHNLVFPGRVLGAVWRGLKAIAPTQIAKAELSLYDYRPGESSTEPFDRLVRLAAEAIRAGELRDFVVAAEACDEAWAGGATAFLVCLDIAPVVRAASFRLPEWTTHFGDQVTAGTRLAYKDAVSISEDAGPCFFEMLAAQLPHSWMVLRVISAVMDKPTERYLADSELGGFGERVMSDIDDALKAISQLDLDGGSAVAVEAAKLVELITLQATELETCVDLSREHGWGLRLVKQRNSLASVVEARLRETEKYAAQALPTGPAKLRRIRRSIPRLNLAPDETAVRRSLTLLAFAREVRTSANYGGFAAARTKTLEKLGEMLDHYVEEVLDLLKTHETEHEDNARAFLTVAAEFSRLVRDDKAADLVRRRAAAAGQPEPPARASAGA
jgi:hypothetical protein